MRRTVIGTAAVLVGTLALAGCGSGSSDEASGATGTRPDRLPDIVLVSLDTTRADRLGCYGYDRPTSPRLDALAEVSTLYLNAYSTSSWTLPAHASLFTGKFPTSHGARYDENGPLALTSAIDGPDEWSQFRARGLAVGETTLAARLAGAGYATAGFVGGPWLKAIFGLDAGFGHYDDAGITELNGRPGAEVTDAALAWLAQQGDRPVFLFLNYYDPHYPYTPAAEYAEPFLGRTPTDADLDDRARLPDLYDGEILATDAQVGRLLDGLAALGRLGGAWIVVVADHGDLVGDGGRFGHGDTLMEAEIRVPLIVKRPDGVGAGARVQERVQVLDVPGTLLSAVGLPPLEGAQGGTLDRPGHPVVAELYPVETISHFGDWRVVFDGRWKYAWNDHGGSYLADVHADPAETIDHSLQYPDVVERLRRALEAYLEALPPPGDAGPPRELDEETRRALESLGYLQ